MELHNFKVSEEGSKPSYHHNIPFSTVTVYIFWLKCIFDFPIEYLLLTNQQLLAKWNFWNTKFIIFFIEIVNALQRFSLFFFFLSQVIYNLTHNQLHFHFQSIETLSLGKVFEFSYYRITSEVGSCWFCASSYFFFIFRKRYHRFFTKFRLTEAETVRIFGTLIENRIWFGIVVRVWLSL